MSSPHVYWHIYPQNQIRNNLRGELICVIEVPWVSGSPVFRDIIDPAGQDSRSQTEVRFPALLRPNHHGIMYIGVNKPAVYKLMLTDPQMEPEDANYAVYNRQIITNARNFFLLDPNRGFKAMPQHLVQLL